VVQPAPLGGLSVNREAETETASEGTTHAFQLFPFSSDGPIASRPAPFRPDRSVGSPPLALRGRFPWGSLQERNEHLYYAFITAQLAEVLPIISTPTVGEACMNYSYLYNYPRPGPSLPV